ncbi:hypothetical protein NOF04DRAFT_1280935 [Fusarium oxysporum II5]|nr:hypothetical protein NOF04DRAFT_1280935 [Fusarium oxysporum II5]
MVAAQTEFAWMSWLQLSGKSPSLHLRHYILHGRLNAFSRRAIRVCFLMTPIEQLRSGANASASSTQFISIYVTFEVTLQPATLTMYRIKQAVQVSSEDVLNESGSENEGDNDPAGVRSLGQGFHGCSAPGTELTPRPISPINTVRAVRLLIVLVLVQEALGISVQDNSEKTRQRTTGKNGDVAWSLNPSAAFPRLSQFSTSMLD